MPPPKAPIFSIGDEVRVRKDGRIGTVINLWQARINRASLRPGSHKYHVRFIKSTTPSITTSEYFFTKELDKAK